MRLRLLFVLVIAGFLPFALRHQAAAAPATPRLPSTSAGASIENIYYYHGRHYSYRYNGRYYAHRSYRNGHWRYY
jgi:hypothetical protein